MSIITPRARRLGHADKPFNGNFAREITLAEFGPRNGRALDQADFTDRLPGDLPMSAPGARR